MNIDSDSGWGDDTWDDDDGDGWKRKKRETKEKEKTMKRNMETVEVRVWHS